jgi:hypothetical protein
VEKYLRGRRITLPIPTTLRHHPNLLYKPTGQYFHALVAAVQDPGGEIVAIHRIYLLSDGRRPPVVEQKMSLGPCKGNAVRLGPVKDRLLLAEGIESALSAMQLAGFSAWASIGTGGLSNLYLPSHITEVLIAADGDVAGRKAAQDAAERWRARGVRVRIKDPGDGMDYNDLLQRGAAA